SRESSKLHDRRMIGWVTVAMLLGAALLQSGAAGLMNQVVWQGALRVYLGGSESICSMIVVLVFMVGLGIGSIWMSGRATRLANPLKSFAILETLLGLTNLGVCGLLTLDLSQSVFTLQRVAVSVGLPLTALYAMCAIPVLGLPCLLMGMTLPLAAETCQRSLGVRNARLLGLLFFVNTVGSVGGAVVSGGHLIAHWGQTPSLILAASLNLLAGGYLALLWFGKRSAIRAVDASPNKQHHNAPYPRRRLWQPTHAEWIAGGLGFCSLGFEMYLFRLIPLRHQPLPYTFSAVLAGFLAYWSLGAAMSAWKRHLSISTTLRITAITVVGTIPMFVWDTRLIMHDSKSLVMFVVTKWMYFLPCVGFGYLFGLVNRLAVKSWGHDVGRIAGWNTCGACVGILTTTLLGYELPFFLMPLIVALLLAALQEFAAAEANAANDTVGSKRWLFPVVAGGLVCIAPLLVDMQGVIPDQRVYCGREGVIAIETDGDLNWSGLWHSALSQDGNHVGSNNWHLAVAPVICHPTGNIKDVCVIGVSTGITASTFAKLASVEQVDGYDISHMLKRIYRDYPDGTLNIATNPKIHLIWQDARTGLNVNSKQYDIIQTQPLYLKQAGSSVLNSIEFFRLVASRLKPDGVFCLYSNGTAEQSLAVRETALRVFRHHETFFNGYLLVLSDSDISLNAERVTRQYTRDDPLWDEIRGWEFTNSAEAYMKLVDRPKLFAGRGRLVISDMHPICEFPDYLKTRVAKFYGPLDLPRPDIAPGQRRNQHNDID
ncbi:MAG: hypothetical protein O3A00_18130, partial [Planctomycetota bacterium]|nr:hypothetical protein [Planctomycetota bacterium]